MASQTSILGLTIEVNNELALNMAAKNVAASQSLMKKTAEELAIAQEKTSARIAATTASLQKTVSAVENASAALNKQQADVASLQARFENLSATIDNLRAQEAGAAGAFFPELLDEINRLEVYEAELKQVKAALDAAPAAVQKLGQAYDYAAAQVAVKTARLKELNSQLGQINNVQEAQNKTESANKNIFQRLSGWFQEATSSYKNFIGVWEELNTNYRRTILGIQDTVDVVNKVSRAFRGGVGFFDEAKTRSAGSGAGNAQLAQGVGQATQTFKLFGLEVQRATNPLQQFSLVAGATAVAIGTGVVQTAMAAGQALINFGKQAISAVSDFERTTLSLKALVGQEMMQKDSNLQLTDAMAQATPVAIQLQGWLQKLAIQSPFSVTDIKQSFQFAKAMGFTSDETKTLINSLTNWAAATGKGGDSIYRATYAMGQMRSMGKMLGGEVMQLAQSGIAVDQILGRAMNKTTAEIRDMREKGLIPVNDALQMITDSLQKDFGQAAKDQANTMAGLLNSLQDLTPMFLREFFGPMDLVTGKVNGVLGAIQERMIGFVGFLQEEWVTNTVRMMGEGLGGVADNAFSWGENLAVQFAAGIESGINYILGALTEIANAVTYWLMPGSPPKILPNIDTWGAETMSVYMAGFKSADFDVFDDISGTIEGYMRTLPEDIMPENVLIETGQRIRSTLIGAISGGTLGSQGTISSLTAGMGSQSGLLANYISTAVQLDSINKQVEASQLRINQITSEYDALLAQADESIRAVDEAQQNYIDANKISQLEMVANDPSATLQEKAMARFEIDRINAEKKKRLLEKEKATALSAEDAKLQPILQQQALLKEQLDIQKRLLGFQEKQNNVLQTYADIARQIAEAANKADKTPTGGGSRKPAAMGGAGLKVPDVGEAIAGKVETLFTKLQDKFGAKWNPLVEAFTNMKEAFDNKFGPVIFAAQSAFSKIWFEIRYTYYKYVEPFINKVFGKLFDNISIPKISDKFLFSLIEGIITLTDFIVTTALPTIGKFFDYLSWIVDNPSQFIGGIQQAFQNFVNWLAATFAPQINFAIRVWQFLSNIFTVVGSNIGSVFLLIGSYLSFVGNTIGTFVQPIFQRLADFINNTLGPAWVFIGQVLLGAVALIVSFAAQVYVALFPVIQAMIELDTQLRLMLAGLVTALGEALSPIFALLGQLYAMFIGTFLDMDGALIGIFKATLGVLYLTLQGAVTILLGVVQGFLFLVTGIFKALTSILKGDWNQAWIDIKYWTIVALQALWTSLLKFVNDVLSNFGQTTDSLVKIWSGVWEQTKTLVTVGGANVLKSLGTWLSDVLKAFVSIDWKKVGLDMMKGVADGILEGIGWVVTAAKEAIWGAITAAKKVAGIKSPSRKAKLEVGLPIGKGIAGGILASIPLITGAMSTAVSAPMTAAQMLAGSASYSTSNTSNYNYSPTYVSQASSPVENFGLMRAMWS